MAAAHKIAMRMIREPACERAYAPNREMSRQVLQRYMHSFLKHYLKKDNYTEGRGFASNTISLRNGSILQFRSYEDHPQTGAGDQLHIVWLDEVPKARAFPRGHCASNAPLWPGDLHTNTR